LKYVQVVFGSEKSEVVIKTKNNLYISFTNDLALLIAKDRLRAESCFIFNWNSL
jgi:hypothetical protein